jgi:hypothetical protein
MTQRTGFSNADSLELKIPDCKCSVPSGLWYDQINGYGVLRAGDPCRCTISPCAADAFEQLQVQQVAQAGNIIKLESAIEEIKFSLASPMNTTDPFNHSLSDSIEFVSVYAEVHKWLSQKM